MQPLSCSGNAELALEIALVRLFTIDMPTGSKAPSQNAPEPSFFVELFSGSCKVSCCLLKAACELLRLFHSTFLSLVLAGHVKITS